MEEASDLFLTTVLETFYQLLFLSILICDQVWKDRRLLLFISVLFSGVPLFIRLLEILQ